MLIDGVRSALRERRLLRGARCVLVACSGGPDSSALLHVLHALRREHRCELFAASVDHGLRPDAARDVASAGQLAAHLEVPFFALKVAVEAGASRQAAARRARYEALLACAATHGADRVATGHTQDDQAETVLARLVRGTGVPGLSAIAPAREDGVVRPLIDCSRAEVCAYVRDHGIQVVEDPSNVDPRYGRVRVRHGLLPALVRENPQVVPALCALADEAREARRLIERESARLITVGRLSAPALLAESQVARSWALKAWCERQHGITLLRAHLVALDRMLSKGGEVRLPGDRVASLDDELCVVVHSIRKRGRGIPRPTSGGQG